MMQRVIKLFFCLWVLADPLALNLKAQQTPLAQERQIPAQGKEDASRLISLDVKDADIKDVMRLFSQVSGLNIIVSDDVKATVTVSLANVDWEDGLNMILRTNNLTSVKQGKFLRIMTFERYSKEEQGVPLVNETIILNFAKAADIGNVLTPMRSMRGSVSVYSQTNSLVITETPDNFRKMSAIIEKLDKRTPQVMIEAMMVDVKLGAEDQLGIDWTVTHKEVSSRSITQDLSADVVKGGVIRYGKTFSKWENLTALIDFWCQQRKSEVLANPKIMSIDGLTANIELVEEVPYKITTTSNGVVTETIAFKEAGIKLYVTPQINKEGFISLNLKTEQSFRSGTFSGQPIIDSRKAETNLSVRDKETVVIGGLRKKDTSKTIDSLPFIGRIPILGILFQKKTVSSTDSELFIFVTPHITTEPELSPEEKKGLEKFRKLGKKKGDMGFLDEAKPFSLRGAK